MTKADKIREEYGIYNDADNPTNKTRVEDTHLKNCTNHTGKNNPYFINESGYYLNYTETGNTYGTGSNGWNHNIYCLGIKCWYYYWTFLVIMCILCWGNCYRMCNEPNIDYKMIKEDIKDIEIPYFGFWA